MAGPDIGLVMPRNRKISNSDLVRFILEEVEADDFVFNGNNLTLDCPSCRKEGHFGVSVERLVYNCFKCECRGKIRLDTSATMSGWKRVLRLVRGNRDVVSGGREDGRVAVSLPFWPIGVLPESPSPTPRPGKPTQKQCLEGIRYLLGRGVTADQIRDYKVSMLFADPRVYFPYWNPEGETIFWMGRLYEDDPDLPKTMEPGHPAVKPLFGLHVRPAHYFNKICVLVEGVFDHLTTPHSLALMGSSINPFQIGQLKDINPRKVVVLLDPDAMRKSLHVLSVLLRQGFPALAVTLRTDKDPGDLGPAVMQRVVDRLQKVEPVGRCSMTYLDV